MNTGTYTFKLHTLNTRAAHYIFFLEISNFSQKQQLSIFDQEDKTTKLSTSFVLTIAVTVANLKYIFL